MMKIIVVGLCLILSGCSLFSTSVPVERHFPDVPTELKVECPDLQQTPPGAKLSEVLSVVTKNYSTYHECRARQSSWIEWYDAQKKIFEEVK
jgi:hypothetical protein